MDKIDISVVAPAKDEERSLDELHRGIVAALAPTGKSFELILIDDGSRDGTLAEMKRLRAADPRVRVVSFLKNFGKSAALAAGFERARGDIVITIDSDLQDDPAEIPRFLDAIAAGAHLVTGWKTDRRDPAGRRLASRIANGVTSAFTGAKVHDMNCGFKAYRRMVIEQLALYGDLHRFVPALAAARGFTVAEIPVHHRARPYGQSRYGLERLPRGFFDLLTVLFLTAYARRPLHLFGGMGLGFAGLGFLALAYLSVLWFLDLGPIGTRPLFMGGIMLMILGAQLLSLGLVGELITNLATKPRDHYVVAEEWCD
jgi:glycosyltransferase involved in cell wall biosynthesis